MPGNPLTDPNWAADITNQITSVIGTVRDKTTNNAIVAIRAIVFGLIAIFLAVVLVVLLLVALTRGMQVLFHIAGLSWPRSVYASYLLIGGIFTLAGALQMRKRHQRS